MFLQNESKRKYDGDNMENIKTINAILTDEEIKQLEDAKKKPIVFDEDCLETTPERAIKFRRVNPPRRILG